MHRYSSNYVHCFWSCCSYWSCWNCYHNSLTFIIIFTLIASFISVSVSFSTPSSNKNTIPLSSQAPSVPVQFPFQKFSFAPNNVCTHPEIFYCHRSTNANCDIPRIKSSHSNNVSTKNIIYRNEPQGNMEFTLKNVPGDGDCMFLAVALATSTSMGLGGNNALLNAVAAETREVVAQVLSTPQGNLHVDGKRIVKARDLLRSAARNEHVSMETYIDLLRNGTLQGGGPELTVLSNVLRRPISIYEVDELIFDYNDDNSNLSVFNEMENNSTTVPISMPSSSIPSRFRIKCVGTFGDLFIDPCSEIPNPAVISGLLPGAYSWHIHLLILDSGPNEKHACALLPKQCYL